MYQITVCQSSPVFQILWMLCFFSFTYTNIISEHPNISDPCNWPYLEGNTILQKETCVQALFLFNSPATWFLIITECPGTIGWPLRWDSHFQDTLLSRTELPQWAPHSISTAHKINCAWLTLWSTLDDLVRSESNPSCGTVLQKKLSVHLPMKSHSCRAWTITVPESRSDVWMWLVQKPQACNYNEASIEYLTTLWIPAYPI